MAHAGGCGGSGGRGLSGARWGRSGSGGHEKLPVHVEDALTYLDQVKIRFGSDPATYNGFLEIMKEFKSQSIDTPGVIRRVSQLFHEHPDLIVGFNAFLPLGYRIDIPKNGKLNIQSPLSSQENSHNHSDCTENYKQQLLYKEDKPQVPLESDSVEFNNAISYVNKIKTRFLDHPEIYRSFLEILHTYQKEQLGTKSRPFRGMSEEEVFTEVANLFRGQEDLLSEFGQFLPEAKRSLFTGNGPCEMNSVQKSEHEKNLEHSKKRSRPSLFRPVSAPAKVIASLRCGCTCVWAHGSFAFSELGSSIRRPQASRPGAGG
uniref:SIN3 transcription regulator family member B n=1 Tax=Pipistrellus kuhlii TaxID=59472 RepID=A0A7J7S4Y8_PIPKU|nr:SIN3 transcription regulator family member B [Pipistrellus kuhlii]